jgi:hypothetical protein
LYGSQHIWVLSSMNSKCVGKGEYSKRQRCSIFGSCHRFEEQLEDQNESRSRGMVQTIRKYFEYYYQNNGKPWFQRFKFQRKPVVSINRISGHYCIKGCFIRFNMVHTEMCECGKAKETINHILWQCKLFEEFTVHTIDDLTKRKIFPPYSIEAILHCMLPDAVIPVARYINSIIYVDITISPTKDQNMQKRFLLKQN